MRYNKFCNNYDVILSRVVGIRSKCTRIRDNNNNALHLYIIYIDNGNEL